MQFKKLTVITGLTLNFAQIALVVFTLPQCKASCPTVDGCVKQPSDYWESWFATYNRVLAKLTNKQDYWENWYKSYSQKFSEQLQKHQGEAVI